MMKLLARYKWLLGILVLATALRFWQLGEVPVSPDWDEAALGYNAYSILRTGRDEYGTFLPTVLRSFDDYKPPLYAYLAIPPIAAFGLNVWAVRLPSALMGVLAVLGTYLLIFQLLRNESGRTKREALALLSAFLLAISPWHLQFSRIAFEANVALTIVIWAVYTFLRGTSSTRFLGVSAFLFGLGMYAYHTEKVFLPILALVLFFAYKKELLANPRRLLVGVFIGIITILPLIPVLLSPDSWTRLSGTSSIADKTGLLMRTVGKLEDDAKAGHVLGMVFDNRRVVYAQKLAEGYLSHFSLEWLFLTGDNSRHHAPGVGLLYLAELPLLLWGLFAVWKKKDQVSRIMLSWFLIAPIAASPTSETPHAIRTLVFLPTFQYFVAVGAYEWYTKAQGTKAALWKAAGVLLGLGFALNVLFYLHMYFVHMNKEYSQSWQYGYKQAAAFAQANEDEFSKIVVSTKLEQPHIFFLFYLTYDPSAYLAGGGTASGGFAERRNQFGKYEFRPITWGSEVADGTTLFIGSPGEIPDANLLTIHNLDGSEAIRIAR
jgi:4-amino-4-deoxy-L-arabinose transferase-like glycosyltransferase